MFFHQRLGSHDTADGVCMTFLPGLGDPVQSIDRAIEALAAEEERSERFLHLTAYENRMSRLAHSFLSSNLSFRQHEGTLEEHTGEDVVVHGSFMFMGLPGVYGLEEKARHATQRMFGAAISDFRPTSGLHAMMCTLATATKPGDVVYTIDPMNGGHAASRPLLTNLGRISQYIPWSNGELSVDLERFADVVKSAPPSAIYLEHGTPLFSLPVREIREIVGPDVLIAYDASHTLGLIAGGEFQSPLDEGADILQGNTHKTFPGPQKALLNFRDHEFGLRITEAISNGFVSSQHTHHAIAAYITALEMAEFGRDYARQMLSNAQALANALAEQGMRLVSRNGKYTSSHQILIEGDEIDARCRRLFACGVSTNARYAFGRRVIRIGVQEVTRRGMKEEEMAHIASFLRLAFDPRTQVDQLARRVAKFNANFPNVEYSFDRIRGLGRWAPA